MTSRSSLWVVGAGPMSIAYCKVLQHLGIDFTVICRSNSSAIRFYAECGINPITGGIEHALDIMPPPLKSIIAVPVESLNTVARNLSLSGAKSILLEKPGSLYLDEILSLQSICNLNQIEMYIAYNRRFYSSTQRLRELLCHDGGITSCVFEFTEWSHTICELPIHPSVKKRWFLANSTHVADLVFHFIGLPNLDTSSFLHSGSLDWHPSSSRFHGCGFTSKNIPFSYYSDWGAPGRWKIEFMTRSNRYLLSPMETLQVTTLGSIDVCQCATDADIDKLFKPGLYAQVSAFINDQPEHLCSLESQIEAFPYYQRMAGYSS